MCKPFSFKFKWVNEDGNETGFRSKEGRLENDILFLDDTQIPAAALIEVERRGNHIALTLADGEEDSSYVAIAVTSGGAGKLKTALGHARGKAWSDVRRQQLEAQGRGHEFYETSCLQCAATLDLTGFERTSQVNCPFCHRLSTVEQSGVDKLSGSGLSLEALNAKEKKFGLCDECGMYSKPRRFTIFYFYFLFFFYGWSSSKTWRCPACMRGEAWKMLAGNALFGLGIPVAIIQLVRAYGGTDVGGLFPGLDSANLKARKNNIVGAIDGYRDILKQHPTTAGVKYNLGLAFLADQDIPGAAASFEFALKDCSNYQPAAMTLAGCYEELGETEKLKSLMKQWGVEEDDGDDDAESVAS